ncbi:hypothetical protein T484DRAFT_1876720 [Baffinella frigidus]|nr:hypothetical protein T484DRAFT_1876720 [Cryptophyta sp. CCMP2293]
MAAFRASEGSEEIPVDGFADGEGSPALAKKSRRKGYATNYATLKAAEWFVNLRRDALRRFRGKHFEPKLAVDKNPGMFKTMKRSAPTDRETRGGEQREKTHADATFWEEGHGEGAPGAAKDAAPPPAKAAAKAPAKAAAKTPPEKKKKAASTAKTLKQSAAAFEEARDKANAAEHAAYKDFHLKTWRALTTVSSSDEQGKVPMPVDTMENRRAVQIVIEDMWWDTTNWPEMQAWGKTLDEIVLVAREQAEAATPGESIVGEGTDKELAGYLGSSKNLKDLTDFSGEREVSQG